jgi:hypothetical protein
MYGTIQPEDEAMGSTREGYECDKEQKGALIPSHQRSPQQFVHDVEKSEQYDSTFTSVCSFIIANEFCERLAFYGTIKRMHACGCCPVVQKDVLLEKQLKCFQSFDVL